MNEEEFDPEEFKNYIMSFDTGTKPFVPYVIYNPDGDLLEFFTSRANYFVKHIGKGIGVHFSQHNNDEVVGLTVEFVSNKLNNPVPTLGSYHFDEKGIYVCHDPCSGKFEVRFKHLPSYSKVDREDGTRLLYDEEETEIVGMVILDICEFMKP